MKKTPLIPVILCGGTGTRLWPLSRASFPKQYWALSASNEKTLLQETQERLKGLENLEDPLLICHEEHRFIVAEQMREIKINPKAILLEPIGRNTAPAITLAALKAIENGEDPMLLVLSADHEIKNLKQFLSVIELGRKYADEGRLVTFGILPTSPETGYGYIEAKEQLSKDEIKAVDIERFVEKPSKEIAKSFVRDKRFTWNSGMFLFKASSILKEVKKLEPEIFQYCQQAIELKTTDLDFLRLDKDSFAKCPNLAIDVAVMERTKVGTVLPLSVGWSDVGSWNALWDTGTKNSEGNVIRGKVISSQSEDCYLRSEHRLIVGIGIRNLVVVETDDAVLVADRRKAEMVKNVVKELERLEFPEAKMHKKVYRPWGNYTSIVNGSCWQVKLIEVKPGGSLSLQMHKHRAEHWVVVKGQALVERNGQKEMLSENQSSYIPLGCRHRLSNPSKETLELIEVQSGSYLGEDDIIRLDDCYGRINNN